VSVTGDVRVAQVGCGYWGKNLLRNFAEIGALAAVVDTDPALTATATAAHGVPAMTLDEVLSNPTIHGIALATPANTHSVLAEQALLAGKHVFVEKPVALKPAEAEHIQSIAESRKLTLMVGHLLQYHPTFLALRDLVAQGELGELKYIYSNRMSLGKFRTEENVLWSFAPHDISMILALVDGEEPQALTAQGASFVTEGVADWSTLQMQFASGARAHIQTSWLHPFKEQRLVVIGSKAMAVFEDSKPDWDERLALFRYRIDHSGSAPAPVSAAAEYVRVEKGEPLREECSHFLECIRTGARPRTDGREGIRVLKILERAESAMNRNEGSNQ
jgi:predicted dehydrogenase